MSVIGTFCVGESPDHIKVGGGIGDLREMYLLALLRRDAGLWHERQRRQECFTEHEATKNDEHKKPGDAGKYYRDEPCLICGTNLRYVSTRSCVECLRVKNKKANAARRAAAKLAAKREPVSRPRLRLTQVKRVPVPKAEPDFLRTFEKQGRWSDH